MRFASIVSLLSVVAGAPLDKRQSGALSASDISVLQLALFLEHLEVSLYSGGYLNFTEAQYEEQGFPAPNRINVGVIAEQEAVHVSTIASTLSANGVTPIPACVYKFPYTDVKSFYGLADLITTNGIGAYLGGALGLMDNPALLTIASSILTVEARHDAYLRKGVNQSPFPNPFDTPESAVYAYQNAMPFLANCPELLPIPTPPSLSVAPAQYPAADVDPIPVAGTLELTWTGTATPVSSSTPLYAAFIQGVGLPLYAPISITGSMAGSAQVPSSLDGTLFVVLTTFSGGLNATELAATGTLAGPTVFAIDSAP